MINPKVCDIMNTQIKNELESAYIYLSMAIYFDSVGLEGMAGWMRAQTHEETAHAMKFIEHISERGGKVVLQDLKQLQPDWDSPTEAWKAALEHEKFISGCINDIMTVVRTEQDYPAEPLVAWFAKEQVEEEANTDRVVSQLEMIGDSKQALLMLDREMAGRAFPAGSPFDPAVGEEV